MYKVSGLSSFRLMVHHICRMQYDTKIKDSLMPFSSFFGIVPWPFLIFGVLRDYKLFPQKNALPRIASFPLRYLVSCRLGWGVLDVM